MVVSIRKTSSENDDRLKTDVQSISNGIDAADHREVTRGPVVVR